MSFDLKNFSLMNDNELSALAKTDRDAAALLISRYFKLICIKSELLSNCNTDCDDLKQEGLLGLLSAIDAYDSSRNVRFSTFAEVCIVNRMKSLLAKGNKIAAPVEDFDVFAEDSSCTDSETPESIYLYKEFFSELMEGISCSLSDSEKKVFDLYIQEKSYRVIAEKLGITEKAVDNALQRARRKIRALI